MTKPNKYKLTPAEKKLFEVLINPDNIGKSITDICNLAKVSRFKYYEAMGKEEFSNLVNETTMDLVTAKAGSVLNAAYKYAMKEKGFQDRKMILTIAGIYVDKSQTELSGGIEVSNPYENLTEEELRKLASRDG
ncbi:phBC6A51 family helix-turn-helix protein [Lactococcus lactis]|uniref:phBC6A51 family helix-turn-helix protein n=1 Tax=Lactococcus lactis TaxID=1358 RepID=UPI003F252870